MNPPASKNEGTIMENENTSSMATLYAKMARIMGRLTGIKKSGTNEHFNYKFVKADVVADMIRAELAQENIAFFAEIVNSTQEVYEKTSRNGSRRIRYNLVQYAFTFACGDTGATITKLWQSEAEDDSDKGINKSATAAEKYFLLKTFLLVGDDEPDADKGAGYQQQSSRARQNAPTPAANGNSGQPTPQNANLPPSSAKNGASNANGDKRNAKEKAIAKIIAAGINPNEANKIEPAPGNLHSDMEQDGWANRIIAKLGKASA